MKWAGGQRQDVFQASERFTKPSSSTIESKIARSQLKGTGLNLRIKRVPTRGIFTMEQ